MTASYTFLPQESPAGDGWRAPLVTRDDALEVVVTRLDMGTDAVRASALLLSDPERHRARRFVLDRSARQFIVARAQLRQLLAVRLGARPESIEFVYGAHGKPALGRPLADSGLCFNVSHCEDVAAYAFSYGRPIGIDVEGVRVTADIDHIAARYFSPCESAAYRALDPPDRPLGFVNCWTRKEAFLKALGDGLSMPFDQFDVSLTPGEPAKILRVGNTAGDDTGWCLQSFSAAPGYVAAVASQR